MIEFTDEEGYGKYLDLHECYDRFINLKGMDVSILFIIHNRSLVFSWRTCSLIVGNEKG